MMHSYCVAIRPSGAAHQRISWCSCPSRMTDVSSGGTRVLLCGFSIQRIIDGGCPGRRGGSISMQLGMIGLGRMGGSMVRGLLRGGHACVVFDSEPASVTSLVDQGATGSSSLRPDFRDTRSGFEAASRTPGRDTRNSTADEGYLHCGPAGAGHFVKMVHNGIEYALMAAYAEGFNILAHANVGSSARPADAETAPLRHPELYRYDLPLPDIAELWRRGSVIGSWLLDLTSRALAEHPDLTQFSGRVSDSGEGRWTARAAIESSTPAPVLTAALFQRFSSRGEGDFPNRLLSAMRYQFGGHLERPVDK